MGKEKHQIQVAYSFDRLACQKISQVYRLLVPEKKCFDGKRRNYLTEEKEKSYESSSHLYTCLIREAERREDHR
jgi:hypothetical protein